MRYVGNLCESDAAKYADRRYTHSEKRGGTITHWYDCWSSSDEVPPTFGDSLNITKTRQIDRIVRENPPNDVDSPFDSVF